MKTTGKTLLFLLACTVLSACGTTSSEGSAVPTVSEPSISESKPSEAVKELVIRGTNHVGIREYVTLTATYGNQAVQPKWTSEDSKIAEVSSKGRVKGLSLGTTTIHAAYEGIVADFEIKVTESYALSSLVQRRTKNGYRLSVSSSGNRFTDSRSFSLDVYQNEFDYNSSSSVLIPSYGRAKDGQGKVFAFSLENGQIQSPLYLRDQTITLPNSFLGLVFSSYYPTSIKQDNTYEFDSSTTAGTSLLSSYFEMAVQFYQETKKDNASGLKTKRKGLRFTVKDDSSFTAELTFSDNESSIKMDFSRKNKENYSQAISTYLNENVPSYPEVYPDRNRLYEISQGYNYRNDFGDYINKAENKTIHIGYRYYTDKYIFNFYENDYIEETKDSYQDDPLISHGFVDIQGKKNIPDGSYSFTVENGKVVLGQRQKDSSGNNYSHWYQYQATPTYYLNVLKDEFYCFESVTNDTTDKGNQYVSKSDKAATITNNLFSDIIQLLSASPVGLRFALNEKEGCTAFSIGGLFSLQNTYFYDYYKYDFVNIGTTSSALLDNYLLSLEDAD